MCLQKIDVTIITRLKDYIPLRRKIPGVGGWRWAMPPTPEFFVGANANPFCVLPDAFYPTRNLKFAFYPTRNPNASQWNIGCVGSLALGLCIGHVHFISFVLISFALGSRRKRSFQWNMGFNPSTRQPVSNRSYNRHLHNRLAN